MRRKTTRYILFAILAAFLIAVGIGYRLWTKPREKAEDVKGISVSAASLAQAFNVDEQKADSMYLNKAIVISGTVTETDMNQDGGIMILLDSGNPDLPIQCTMREKNVRADKGSTITIKGFCSGSSITGVLLTDCIIKQ